MPRGSRPAIFVDRDNTIIEDPGYLRDCDRVQLLPGAAGALARLRDAGYPVVVVTNQSGIARGYLTEEELAAIHQRLQQLLETHQTGIDAFYYCPFLDGPNAVVEEYHRDSELRKPKPGMLLAAARDLDLDLTRSWMVGDSERDVQAGHAAGCRTILIGERVRDDEPHPDFIAKDFPSAVDWVLHEADEAILPEPLPAPDPDSFSAADTRPSAETPEADRSEQEASDSGHPISPAASDAPEAETPPRAEAFVHPGQSRDFESKEAVQSSAPEAGADARRRVRNQSRIESRLTEILEEFRAMRREERFSDFSIAHLGGAVAQAIALCAVGWGLYAAINGENSPAFIRIQFGIAFQLMALTGFVFGRRK